MRAETTFSAHLSVFLTLKSQEYTYIYPSKWQRDRIKNQRSPDVRTHEYNIAS